MARGETLAVVDAAETESIEGVEETPVGIISASDAPIRDLIYTVRGTQVMLDSDIARLYGVETKNLNRAAKRNEGRFPEDFRFQLTREEHDSLRCQIGTSKSRWR